MSSNFAGLAKTALQVLCFDELKTPELSDFEAWASKSSDKYFENLVDLGAQTRYT
jgi:hypothetical protein